LSLIYYGSIHFAYKHTFTNFRKTFSIIIHDHFSHLPSKAQAKQIVNLLYHSTNK